MRHIIVAPLASAVVAGVAGAVMLAPSYAAEPCVPSEAWSETITVKEAWAETIEHPAVTETVEHPAITEEQEVFDHWQRYSWSGLWESDEAPPFPDARWRANVKGDPHGRGEAGAYFESHGNSGKGEWFYLESVTRVETVVVEEAWTETVVVEPAWTETIEHPAETTVVEHPAVECPPTDSPTGKPTTTPIGGPTFAPSEDATERPSDGPGPMTTPRPTPTDPPTPNIEIPEPGETVVYQAFDNKGVLVEQRVGKPIPTAAKQEGM